MCVFIALVRQLPQQDIIGPVDIVQYESSRLFQIMGCTSSKPSKVSKRLTHPVRFLTAAVSPLRSKRATLFVHSKKKKDREGGRGHEGTHGSFALCTRAVHVKEEDLKKLQKRQLHSAGRLPQQGVFI